MTHFLVGKTIKVKSKVTPGEMTHGKMVKWVKRPNTTITSKVSDIRLVSIFFSSENSLLNGNSGGLEHMLQTVAPDQGHHYLSMYLSAGNHY